MISTMTPFQDNSTAPPSTATGEQRTLLQVSSIVVANNDTNPTSSPIAVGSSKAPRSTTKKWLLSFLAAATLLLVCVARIRGGGVPTVHDSHLVRDNPGSTTSGSRSEMSAVHDSYLFRENPFGTCLNGTVCGTGMSCDNFHVCRDSSGPGESCGYDGDGIDCIEGYFCNLSREYYFYMCTLTGQCAANYGSDEPCCDQKSKYPIAPHYQCPQSTPICVNYVYTENWGTCE